MRFTRKILTEAPVDGATPFKLPSDMLNNPSSINLKGMAAQAKADADKKAAEEAEARVFAANKEKYSDLIAKAKEAGSPDDMLDVLFQELVPIRGQADTVAGELVRAMMRILYRDYNDGDLFYEGYGVETCGSSVAYLIYIIEDLYDKFNRIAERHLEDDAYTDSLNDICNDVLNYIFTNDSVWMPNTDDSRSSQWDKEYASSYQSDWEPEYDYDFQIPPTVQDHIDAGNIITDEFIERVKDALDGNSFIKYDSVEDSWSNYINITGLNRESYDEIRSWDMYEDSAWDYYIDELNSEYGDPNDEDEDDDWDDEDEDLEESVDNAPKYKIGQKVLHHGKETTIRGVEYSEKYGYDLLIDNPEFSTRKYPKEDAWKYKRIWVGEDVELIEKALKESMEEQIIIGFGSDGKRSYYNDADKEWKDSPKEATIYPDNNSARSVWFNLDKKPFKRVFIVCNTDGV